MENPNSPLVSIIVPVYNAATRLQRCIDSILGQRYGNIEVVVVNDGSCDDSMAILNRYAAADSRVLAVDKENRGVAATRNLAIGLARGAYLQFVDSDDYLDENATRLLVERAEETGADLTVAHYCHVDGEHVSVHGFLTQDGVLDKKTFALGLMAEPASFYYGVMWNKLYRTDIIRAHHIECDTELAWSEDFLFNLEYIRHAERFAALKTPVYYYVYNPGSILHTGMDPVAVVKGKVNLFPYYKLLYEDLGLYEQYKPQIYKYLLATAEHL